MKPTPHSLPTVSRNPAPYLCPSSSSSKKTPESRTRDEGRGRRIAAASELPPHMTLTEIKQTLESRRIQLTRSLGQNFLHDGNQLRRLIDTAALTPEDRVLEIGPGLGALTELLLLQVKEVLAIEMDQRLVTV